MGLGQLTEITLKIHTIYTVHGNSLITECDGRKGTEKRNFILNENINTTLSANFPAERVEQSGYDILVRTPVARFAGGDVLGVNHVPGAALVGGILLGFVDLSGGNIAHVAVHEAHVGTAAVLQRVLAG